MYSKEQFWCPGTKMKSPNVFEVLTVIAILMSVMCLSKALHMCVPCCARRPAPATAAAAANMPAAQPAPTATVHYPMPVTMASQTELRHIQCCGTSSLQKIAALHHHRRPVYDFSEDFLSICVAVSCRQHQSSQIVPATAAECRVALTSSRLLQITAFLQHLPYPQVNESLLCFIYVLIIRSQQQHHHNQVVSTIALCCCHQRRRVADNAAALRTAAAAAPMYAVTTDISFIYSYANYQRL